MGNKRKHIKKLATKMGGFLSNAWKERREAIRLRILRQQSLAHERALERRKKHKS
jgi:hypothetical protein